MARRKTPTASSLTSKFHQTIAGSSRFRAEDPNPGPYEEETRRGGYRTRGQRSEREEYNIARSDFLDMSKEEASKQGAYWKVRATRNVPRDISGPAVAEMDEEWSQPAVRSQDVKLARRGEREQQWKTAPNIYRVPPRDKKSANSFIKQELPPSHQQWVNEQLDDPRSEFNAGLNVSDRAKTGRYTSGQRRRLQRYTDALQQGETHQQALDRVRRTRLRQEVGAPTMTDVRRAQSKQVQRKQPAGREAAGRFRSLAPTPAQFSFGIDSPPTQSMDAIKRRFPDASEQEWLQIQQAGTEALSQEMLANQKWAHETKRSNLLGQRTGRAKEASDKITIFTTNVGHPSVSVPADSLVGQYIIRKRKSVLSSYGVPSSQLRGAFPDMVRDQHIVDIATGASLGVQGRGGVMNTTGYRFGKRASSGYGRPRPLGAQVLYDSSTGRPLYDSQGNIRYSEGTTRPIDWATPNVGARILIG